MTIKFLFTDVIIVQNYNGVNGHQGKKRRIHEENIRLQGQKTDLMKALQVENPGIMGKLPHCEKEFFRL